MFRQSDILVDGRYYFTPAGTPHYPFQHNLGSRDWVSDERFVEPELGEWNGPYQWDNGQPPAPLPLPVLVGSKDCIANGETPPPDPFEGEPSFTTQSFPAGCFGVPQAQRIAFDIEECNTTVPFAEVLYQIPLNDAAAGNILAAMIGPGYTITTFPNDASTIPGCVIAVGPRVIVILTGTSNFQQLAAQVLYLGFGLTDFGSFSCIAIVHAAALAIEARMTAAGAAGISDIWYAGHSYGGAVAQILAARMAVNMPGNTINLVTYGSPSAGDIRVRNLLANTRQIHFVNDDDPIPSLPPKHGFLLGIAAFLGFLLTVRWENIALARRRHILFADGTSFDSEDDVLPINITIALSQLIGAAVAMPAFNSHFMDEYLFRLSLTCAGPFVPPPFLNFRVIIDEISWNDTSLIYNVSCDITLTPTTALGPWTGSSFDDQFVEIFATLDDLGNFKEFRVFHLPNRYLPFTNNFLWRFAGGAVAAGIDTMIFPSVGFANPAVFVVSLVRLRVIPLFAP